MRLKRTRDMILCAMFVALIVVGAFIRIPTPVVPITLQYTITMLAGMILGGRLGCLSVLVYMALGLIGIPVFTGGGGIGYIFQPTFGYIIGFAIGAFITGKIARGADNPGLKRLLIANLSGMVVVYFIGTVYCYLISAFYLGNSVELWGLLMTCVLLPIPSDIFFCVLGAVVGKKLLPILNRNQIGVAG